MAVLTPSSSFYGGFEMARYAIVTPRPDALLRLPARVIESYEAQESSELSAMEGDVVMVDEQDETGWWACTVLLRQAPSLGLLPEAQRVSKGDEHQQLDTAESPSASTSAITSDATGPVRYPKALLGPEGKAVVKSPATPSKPPAFSKVDTPTGAGMKPSMVQDDGSSLPPSGFIPCTFLEWIDPAVVGLQIEKRLDGSSVLVPLDKEAPNDQFGPRSETGRADVQLPGTRPSSSSTAAAKKIAEAVRTAPNPKAWARGTQTFEDLAIQRQRRLHRTSQGEEMPGAPDSATDESVSASPHLPG